MDTAFESIFLVPLGWQILSWHLVLLFHDKEIGKMWEQHQISFSWAPKSMQMVTAATELKDTCSLEE